MNEKEKLLAMIRENLSIRRYRELETIINQDPDIQAKMAALINLQKQLVNAREFGKREAAKQFEQHYETMIKTIEDYPLMSEYIALQGDINDMIKTIMEILENGINDDLEK